MTEAAGLCGQMDMAKKKRRTTKSGSPFIMLFAYTILKFDGMIKKNIRK